ncbi:hypothetical protein KUTeg_000818 [Tegillarca granosa]|uniref:ShKT domain-containing protein n=1 Tax=Tegillarca granosa TaxID=220873 RepID=A0ABQ9G207_TEGGR|nr:hypothetical protein KUTeg_000818 [Tegillarca granosa]
MVEIHTHDLLYITVPTQTLGASSGNCSDQLSDCSALQKQVNVCSQPQTAALCQQTCGLCTGTCKDQLSDCSVLKQQVNVCGDKTSAALCQQTCGLCGSTINGGWSNWSPWGNCSKTCGSGTESRTRSCSHPAPNNGGAQCSGSATESKSCLLKHCPLNGGWSNWSPWGHCSKTCGSGTETRTRSCSHPAPNYGGAQCSGSATDSKSCLLKHCPLNGEWSNWSPWGHCSKTCGSGTETRTRSCSHPAPNYGGAQCSGSATESKSCLLTHCPLNGGWSSWSSWGNCSKTCGSGTETRTRSCSHPAPNYGGAQCSGSATESKSCLLKHCPLNGGWSSWSSWGHCSKTCGSGTETKTRSCSHPAPNYGGAQCSGSATESKSCLLKHCPLNGGWNTWSPWGHCSKTCGSGTETRTRSCSHPAPNYGGAQCSGSATESKSCLLTHCPLNGGWGSWSSWGHCSKTCGSGTETRTRSCSHPAPNYGGAQCSGSATESKSCLLTHCPLNGGWGSWSSWGHCSKTCGSGTETRTRACSHPAPNYGGSQCSGSATNSKSCLLKHCPLNGGWSSWSSWGHCSKTCGSGTETRTRSCSHPAPNYGGAQCSGSATDSKSCLLKHCPLNGGWSSWSSWGHCSKTCGSGTETRTRSCSHPAPNYGGAQCSGSATESKSCLLKHCPLNGGWSSWSSWGHCSKTCGSGTETRTRSCSHPAPNYGGAQCSGSATESKSCLLTHCPLIVNGGWSSWVKYGQCTVSCGGGNIMLRRTCSNPAPSGGGSPCSGSDSTKKSGDMKFCNLCVFPDVLSEKNISLIRLNNNRKLIE